MLYPRRVHVLRDVTDLDQLAELLAEHTWTLCAGFRLTVAGQTILLLNDSTSEDGAQEYAVVLPDGRQIESVTFGWCDRARAACILRDILAGEHDPGGASCPLRIDADPEHICELCRDSLGHATTHREIREMVYRVDLQQVREHFDELLCPELEEDGDD